MTKEQFFHELANALRKLPQNEREEIMQDFAEHFAIGEEEGKSEEEIIRRIRFSATYRKRNGSDLSSGSSRVTSYYWKYFACRLGSYWLKFF